MAKRGKRPERIRIYDPITGNYKTVKNTPQLERERQARIKERERKEREAKRRSKTSAAKTKLSELQRLNPGQYEGYVVVGGKIKSPKAYESEYDKIKDRLNEQIEKAKAAGRSRAGLHKKYALNEIRYSKKGRAMQALKDINELRSAFTLRPVTRQGARRACMASQLLHRIW